jgi:hypothetical protein
MWYNFTYMLNMAEVIYVGVQPPPDENEIASAKVLAEYYQCKVTFLQPSQAYMRKTQDFVMHDKEWELKCPRGKSRNTISYCFERAKKQSPNLVVDTSLTPLSDEKIEKELRRLLVQSKSIKRLLMINKNRKIVDISGVGC